MNNYAVLALAMLGIGGKYLLLHTLRYTVNSATRLEHVIDLFKPGCYSDASFAHIEQHYCCRVSGRLRFSVDAALQVHKHQSASQERVVVCNRS
jgi:hypothetical protein